MAYNFSSLQQTLQDIHGWLVKEYASISTGRANPALLDGVFVESYGSMQPVKNLASINLEDARTLRIAPWDKSVIKDIERALVTSSLPVSVNVDADGVRVIIPQLTAETRLNVVKLAKEKLEDARIKVRQERQSVEKDIDTQSKDGIFGEDDKFRYKEELQKHIDTANKKLEELYSAKEKEITTI